MSTTNPRAERPIRRRPRDLDPSTTPASDIYPEYIVENDDLCPRCFRQKFDAVETSDDRLADRDVVVNEGGEETVELEQLVRTVEWTTRDYVPPRDGESFATLEKTVCSCGDVDGSEIRTRTRSEAISHAANISALLDRWSVPNDWLELVTRVANGKRQPRTAGNDWLVLDIGVTAAVRIGRGLDPEPALETVRSRY